MPIIKSDTSIDVIGTRIENLMSFCMKGRKMMPARRGVKFGG
tara:strand:+ start:64 stop:189 length:126 start_codon:yes stop_codon:yes gene_type:complete